MWVVAFMIIALIILVVYSFMTKGFVFRFLDGAGTVHDDTDYRAHCIADPGSPDDEDGDGYIDGKVSVDGKEYDCSKLSVI